MFEFIAHLVDDLHPILIHFPITLLVISFCLVFVRPFSQSFVEVEWWSFALGALLALPATISGVVAHFPYEEIEAAHEAVEIHQLPSMIGTLVMLIVLIWRFRSRRKGNDSSNDIGNATWYFAFAAVGLVWIFIVGGTGGALTYDYGIGVRGVNPLLP